LESENSGKLEREREMIQREPRLRNIVGVSAPPQSSVHGCFSGGNSCDIYLWWILWDKHIQNEKGFIRASAGVFLFVFVWRVLTVINLTP
jgi:hypothetical protein